MANTGWRWALAGALLGAMAALLVAAPARWLSAALATATQQRVLLLDTRGSAWTGDARLVLAAGPGAHERALLPGRVAWTLRPTWDGFKLRVVADCCAADGVELRGEPRMGGWRLSVGDGLSRWPAGVLQGLGAPWNTIDAQGRLELAPQGLSLEWSGDGMVLAGRLRVDALGMSSRLSTLRPIGSYRLDLQGQAGAPATLRLQTLEGSLRLQGSGQLTAAGWRFRGEAQAAPQTEAALSNLLNIVGRREGAGSVISIG